MTDFRLPISPSSYTLVPLIHQHAFVASNRNLSRGLLGGSRYSLQIQWKNLDGDMRRQVEGILEVAGIAGNSVLVHMKDDLGYEAPKAKATTSALAKAGSTSIAATISTASLPAMALLAHSGRLYRSTLGLPVGAGTIHTSWQLRKDIPAGAELEIGNPIVRMVATPGTTPTSPVTGRRYGRLHGPSSVDLVEAT